MRRSDKDRPFNVTLAFRRIFLAGALCLLAACAPSIDDVARENGCGGLRRNIQTMFVVAGWWAQGQREIAAHEKKWDKSNLYRIVEERKYGGYGMYNKGYYQAATAFFNDLKEDNTLLGEALADHVAEAFSEDFYQAEKFKKCSTYLNQILEDPEYLKRIWGFFANPTMHDKYEG